MWPYYVEGLPSVPTFWRVFITNRCWILSKAFLYLLKWSHGFYSSICWNGVLHWFADVEKSLCPWGESHLIVLYDLFNVLLDTIASILLRIFVSMFISEILACNFFLWYLWFWYKGDGGLIKWIWEVFLPLQLLATVSEMLAVNSSLNVW